MQSLYFSKFIPLSINKSKKIKKFRINSYDFTTHIYSTPPLVHQIEYNKPVSYLLNNIDCNKNVNCEKIKEIFKKHQYNMKIDKIYKTYLDYKGADNDKDVQMVLIICITYIYYLVILLYIYMSFFG